MQPTALTIESKGVRKASAQPHSGLHDLAGVPVIRPPLKLSAESVMFIGCQKFGFRGLIELWAIPCCVVFN